MLQVWINQGDIILLSLRDFQDGKADVIQKYTASLVSLSVPLSDFILIIASPLIQSDEARNLKAYGELPETGEQNRTGHDGCCITNPNTIYSQDQRDRYLRTRGKPPVHYSHFVSHSEPLLSSHRTKSAISNSKRETSTISRCLSLRLSVVFKSRLLVVFSCSSTFLFSLSSRSFSQSFLSR